MHLSTTIIYDVIGTVGACFILLGFYRTSIGQWKNRSFIYELDNLAGASLLIIYQLHHKAYISVVLNIIWAVVAFRGVISFTERYRMAHGPKKRRRA